MEKLIPVLDKVVIVTLFVFVAFSMFSISVTQIAFGLGGVAWLLRTQLTDEWKSQRWPLGLPIILFVLACLVAVIDAYDMSYSYGSLKKLFQILIFFWVINCVRENQLRDSLIRLLIVSATLAGLYGFYQAWTSGVSLFNRVNGSMSIYMTFAGLLMMVGLIAFARVLFERPVKAWVFAAITIICGCLILTLTRQAWFGFLLGLCFLGFVWRKKFFLIATGLVLILAVTTTTLTNIKVPDNLDRPESNAPIVDQVKYRLWGIVSGVDETFDIRLALWQGGWEIFKSHPLTGCGFRCVDLMNTHFPDPTGFVKRYRGMHNNIVQLAVDTGVLGLITWLGIWVGFFTLLYKRSIKAEDPHERSIIFGSTAAVLAFLAGGFFESNFYDSEVAMVLYFVMALPFCEIRLPLSFSGP